MKASGPEVSYLIDQTLEAVFSSFPDQDWSCKELKIQNPAPEISVLSVGWCASVLYEMKWLLFCNQRKAYNANDPGGENILA